MRAIKKKHLFAVHIKTVSLDNFSLNKGILLFPISIIYHQKLAISLSMILEGKMLRLNHLILCEPHGFILL